MKSFKWSFVFILLMPQLLLAQQIQPEGSASPKCYTGNAKSALKELLETAFDPMFSNEFSRIEGSTIVGVQIDENEEALTSRLPKCSESSNSSKIDLSGLELSKSQTQFINAAQKIIGRIVKNSNTQCQLSLTRKNYSDETATIVLDLSKGGRHFQITVVADGMHPGLKMTKTNYFVGSPLGAEFGNSGTILELDEPAKMLIVSSFQEGDRTRESLECGFDLQ